MHLLTTTQLREDEAIAIAQSSGDVVILSAADSDLSLLARAKQKASDLNHVRVRLFNYGALSHPLSVDDYMACVVQEARFVAVRLLGGIGSWSYGVECLQAWAAHNNRMLVLLSGDGSAGDDLHAQGTVTATQHERLAAYLNQGGEANALAFLRYAHRLVNGEADDDVPPPQEQPQLGIFCETETQLGAITLGRAFIIAYGAHVRAGDTAHLESLVTHLQQQKIAAHVLYVRSLKDDESAAFLKDYGIQYPPHVIITTTGFAASSFGDGDGGIVGSFGVPVLQAVACGQSLEAWRDQAVGLTPRDIAMQVALPEVDGRIIAPLISHKQEFTFAEEVDAALTQYAPYEEGIATLARLARRWVTLQQKPQDACRIAIILANVPHSDGKIANGVGLNTPASLHHIMGHLGEQGYDIGTPPASVQEWMDVIKSGITNEHGKKNKEIRHSFPLAAYASCFARLPCDVQRQMNERWGEVHEDAFVRDDALALPVSVFGNVAVAIQPARDAAVMDTQRYHDPLVPPPHGYYGFYVWLKDVFKADAVIHLGKHGTLEWLPGKGVGLSASCYPSLLMGDMPHVYPFIVNDPGEGSQAKRRAAAVIVDHMTPPMMTAELYGSLNELEALADEYEQAARLHPHRLPTLAKALRDVASKSGVAQECDLTNEMKDDDWLTAIDSHLCVIKETQIRGGLHIYGAPMKKEEEGEHLYALTRLPRGDKGDSLLRAMANDCGVSFDPLLPSDQLSARWSDAKPPLLEAVLSRPLRRLADGVEALRVLACQFLTKTRSVPPDWHRTARVLTEVDDVIRPKLELCPHHEMAHLVWGLQGRFVPPGPAGAPSRGRLDVLPTGRNFYSLDPRRIPTAAAYRLGKKSAELLIEDYCQRTGDMPRQLALSVWGTSNMRTGGEDISQAMALMGVAPCWDEVSRRLTHFEIIPQSVLGRPRVDVMLRISGFFRDAFSHLIHLFADAVTALAQQSHEDDTDNPIKAHSNALTSHLTAEGMGQNQAWQWATMRVFGSAPNTYGAAIDRLIDSGNWQSTSDIADQWIDWASYGYSRHHHGSQAKSIVQKQLARVDGVIHNQDNREHDVLDSDDYYQFCGGMTAAVTQQKGSEPLVYHNDHSNVEYPLIQSLAQEINRTVRARAANPKWLARIMQHGYKGAFEIAATVDYLFAFAATTSAVSSHHFTLLFEAYVADDEVRQFMQKANPDAFDSMVARFQEAVARNLWQPHSNHVPITLDRWQGLA